MKRFSNFFGTLIRDEGGAPAIEYALLAAVLALGLVTGMSGLATGINGFFTTISTDLASHAPH
jgi:pilus assembly protein Flp/PilA